MESSKEKIRENRLRRLANRLDARVIKSRIRDVNSDKYGKYMLVDFSNTVIECFDYELNLDDVERLLIKRESELKQKGWI